MEITRGLTEKGLADVKEVTELLKDEGIEVYVSSPYRRAIITIEAMASSTGHIVTTLEELKEQVFSNSETRMPDDELVPLLIKLYDDFNFAGPGGESNKDCQTRAINSMNKIISSNKGKKIAVGTHGAIMTLILGYYHKQYNLDFLLKLSKPDIYKMVFNGNILVEVERIWES
ncbi:histidine phosphatase family protein [Paenibacillus paeoniae]|uniref:Histidine phosphatase family protein n=1 Tax=Paenibacillus paeoniae TaxID=2292705 RepID=A0A371PIZ9_9BACL|nr:histidine phosphatase family protein [Paenibacillus paeoniae]